MYNFSELGFRRARLLNMDEQYLGCCGTEYQVHETVVPWWSNNREADLSDPNLPPDLFLTLAFLQSSSLGANLVMPLSYGFVSLAHTQFPLSPFLSMPFSSLLTHYCNTVLALCTPAILYPRSQCSSFLRSFLTYFDLCSFRSMSPTPSPRPEKEKKTHPT